MRNVLSSVFKRSTLSFMSLVLALSTLTPVLSAQTATAVASGPFNVESFCDADGTVNFDFTFSEDQASWNDVQVRFFAQGHGNSDLYWLENHSTEDWTVDTGLGSTAGIDVTAKTYGVLGDNVFGHPIAPKNTYSVVSDPMSCSKLKGENFNTVNNPYWGISVGFNVKDFGTASAASVTIERADGSTVTKIANPGVLDLISNKTAVTQLTAPFVIQEGAFKEADDLTYWNPAPATWTDATTPVKATISITDQFGTKTAEILNLSQGSPSWPTYASLLPVARTAPPVVPSLSGDVIYRSIPTTLPSNSPSLGYAATSTRAFGDKITFDGTARSLKEVAVTLSSWACESGEWNLGNCVTTPGAKFTHPITLNIYDEAGNIIASRTQTFEIPYRPTADPTCGTATQWRDTNGNCFSGINHVVVFDATGITVPNTVIYSVAFNTKNHGVDPTGSNGPFNSLNVALSTSTTVGTNVNPDEAYWDTTYPGYTAGLKADGGWSASGNPAVMFTATTPVTTGGGSTGGNGGSTTGSNGAGSRTSAPVFAVADIFGINNAEGGEEDVAVLGNASNDKGGEVAGATDNKEDKGCGIFLGICWYYWIPIVVAILAAIYAVRRKLQANNA